MSPALVFFYSFQLGSQDCTQELFNYIISPYTADSRIEFQLYSLRTQFVRQGVVCFHSVGLVVSWSFTVIIFNDSRGSTLFVSLYISFALNDLSGTWWVIYFTVSSTFVLIIVLAWHFCTPSVFAYFYSVTNKQWTLRPRTPPGAVFTSHMHFRIWS